MDSPYLQILRGILPDGTVELINQLFLDPHSAVQIIKRNLFAAAEAAISTMAPAVQPLFDRAVQTLYNSPDVVLVLVFLIIAIIMMQILSMLRRLLMFAARLTFLLMFWSGVAAVVAIIWRRGPEASMRDAMAVSAKVMGYASGIKDVFLREYERYEAQATAHSR